MPKEGIDIPPPTIGEAADAKRFADKQSKRRGKMSAEDVAWLYLCARRPRCLKSPVGSVMAPMMQDDLSPLQRFERFTCLFIEFPDLAGDIWGRARTEIKRKLQKKSKLDIARKTVRDFALDQRLAAYKWVEADLRQWAKRYTTDENRKDVEAEINGLLEATPYRSLLAKTIEAYLNEQYGGEWSATVEDAIQAERGRVSGKKRLKNPG